MKWRIQLSLLSATVLSVIASTLCAAPILSVNGNTISAGEQDRFDLNNDGTSDFEFTVTEDGNDAFIRAIFEDEIPSQTFVPSFFLHGGLLPGDTIDARLFRKLRGSGKKSKTGNLYHLDNGLLPTVGSTAYIALRLESIDSGDRYYGFAQLTRGSITIGEVGFESLPDTPITIPTASSTSATAPEPTSLALLASGAAGLLAYRRRRRILNVARQ